MQKAAGIRRGTRQQWWGEDCGDSLDWGRGGRRQKEVSQQGPKGETPLTRRWREAVVMKKCREAVETRTKHHFFCHGYCCQQFLVFCFGPKSGSVALAQPSLLPPLLQLTRSTTTAAIPVCGWPQAPPPLPVLATSFLSLPHTALGGLGGGGAQGKWSPLFFSCLQRSQDPECTHH